MSYHVYLAREGWKTTPISRAEWQAAASAVPALEVTTKAHDRISVNLVGKPRQWLAWQDGYVFAQAPEEELVKAMFLLAERLDARVFSERVKAYRDVNDWRKRTQAYRERRRDRVAQARAARLQKLGWIMVAVILGLVAGWWFA